MKARMINAPPFNVRSKVGALSWAVLDFMKQFLPEFFLAKS